MLDWWCGFSAHHSALSQHAWALAASLGESKVTKAHCRPGSQPGLMKSSFGSIGLQGKLEPRSPFSQPSSMEPYLENSFLRASSCTQQGQKEKRHGLRHGGASLPRYHPEEIPQRFFLEPYNARRGRLGKDWQLLVSPMYEQRNCRAVSECRVACSNGTVAKAATLVGSFGGSALIFCQHHVACALAQRVGDHGLPLPLTSCWRGGAPLLAISASGRTPPSQHSPHPAKRR